MNQKHQSDFRGVALSLQSLAIQVTTGSFLRLGEKKTENVNILT